MAVTDAAPTSEAQKAGRPNPIALADATAVGQKLAALRAGGRGWEPSRKELTKLAKAGDGLALINQAPRTSSEVVSGLEHMIRMVPTTRRHKPFRLGVGDPTPDFAMLGSHGETVSISSLKGRNPFAIRLTRAQGSGNICPRCVPGLDNLTRTYKD